MRVGFDMLFRRDERTDVDHVEASFVDYKVRHPEEDTYLIDKFVVPSSYRYSMNSLKNSLTDNEVRSAIELAPWGYSFDLSDTLSSDGIDAGTNDAMSVPAGRNDLLLRMSMLRFVFQYFGIHGNWIDVATNCGIIPILVAREWNIAVTGSDLARTNIDKCELLKSLSGDERCRFFQADAFEHLRSVDQGSADLVSALGLFYHLSNPIELLELIFKASRRYALIDTVIHNFSFSGWIQTISRHVKHPNLAHANDTRKILELHPTYRGMIDALYQVGFRSVVEIVPGDEILQAFPDTIYHSRNRRMLLASKI